MNINNGKPDQLRQKTLDKGRFVRMLAVAGNVGVAIVLFSVIPAAPAQAYLDGATVSMVLQAVTGAVASALLFGKMYWGKIKGLFKRSKHGPKD